MQDLVAPEENHWNQFMSYILPNWTTMIYTFTAIKKPT